MLIVCCSMLFPRSVNIFIAIAWRPYGIKPIEHKNRFVKIFEDGKIVSQNGNFTIKVKKKLFLFMVMYFHKVKNFNYLHPQVPLRLTLAGAGKSR